MTYWIIRCDGKIAISDSEATARQTFRDAVHAGRGDVEFIEVEHPLSIRDVAALFAAQVQGQEAADRFARTGRVVLDSGTTLVDIQGEAYAVPPTTEKMEN